MNAKAILRNSAARLLFASGLTLARRQARGRLSIVTFHRVLPEAERAAYPFPGLAVTPPELDTLLKYFTEHFDCGTLARQHERYLLGEEPARPLLAVTFDDAQHDNYRNARPLLSRYGVKASFFAPVAAIERQEPLWHDRLGFSVTGLAAQGPSGKQELLRVLAGAGLSAGGNGSLVENVARQSKKLPPARRLSLVEEIGEISGAGRVAAFARMMTFGELCELAQDGHEIGSHSMTHCMMPECDERSLAYELSESRRVLQVQIGQPIETFCYPNGDCDERSARAVAQAGYRRAVTTTPGNNGPRTDPYQLRRFDMDARRMHDSAGTVVPAVVAWRMSSLGAVSL